MSEKDLWLKSHKCRGRDDAWWYEEPNGITIVVHNGTSGSKIVEIPWRLLRSALKRLDK